MAKCFIAVAIVEVERLWFRFQQLGCNEEGILTAEIFRDPVIAQDVFMKNVISFLKHLYLVVRVQNERRMITYSSHKI